jgi:zinc transport system substrate-binding protein
MRILILLLCLSTTAVAATPRVVTSITPLQEIARALMAGVAIPEVIIRGHASAHHFALKPSHMRMLQQADLVIWVGGNFEAGFNRISEVLPDSTRQLELLRQLKLENSNGHIWYSPRLLLQSIEIITPLLIELDPEHQAQYLYNAGQLSEALARWRQVMRDEWQDRRPRYITDHAFTAHFGAETGLTAIATIHDQHDDHGGIRELSRLEDLLRQKPAACLLTLESPVSAIAQNLARKYHIRIVNVTQLPVTRLQQTLTIQRLEQLNTALLSCV